MLNKQKLETVKFLYAMLVENVEYKKYNKQVLSDNSIKLVNTALEFALSNLVVDLVLKN